MIKGQKFERNATELVAQLNIIAATIQAATKQTILVIIDDLDKLELSVVKPIFRDNIKTLCLPGFHIIYTLPMAILRDKDILPVIQTETNDQIVSMPVLKLFTQQESHNPAAIANAKVMNVLCEILHKRIPDSLLERQVAEALIRYSGGVLRELIRIANECCRICLRRVRREPDNLAELYYSQGRYAEVELLHTRSLDIREHQLGADHPKTVTVRKNLERLRAELAANEPK